MHDQRNVRLHTENGKREDEKAASEYSGHFWHYAVSLRSRAHPLTQVPTLTRSLTHPHSHVSTAVHYLEGARDALRLVLLVSGRHGHP